MNQPQRITRDIQFKVYINPGTEEHLEQVLERYFESKGVDYKNKQFTI